MGSPFAGSGLDEVASYAGLALKHLYLAFTMRIYDYDFSAIPAAATSITHRLEHQES